MTNYFRSATALQTAGAPAAWGTTYWITTELLPPDRPLLAAAGRALPAGVALAIVTRQMPPAGWWARLTALATLNVGLFFVLLFVGAERLPGGVAATAGALAPIIVLLLGWPLLGRRPPAAARAVGAVGVVGVAALVLGPAAALAPLGLAAAAGATPSMGVATVLARRWGPPPMPLIAFTAWQLILGGGMIRPGAQGARGAPPAPPPR